MQARHAVPTASEPLIKLTREQLDELPWAMVKIAPDGDMTYMNPAMCELAGFDTPGRRNIREILDGTNLELVSKHLHSRFRGIADEYDATLIRANDRIPVPAHVSAVPEIDDRGKTIGSIAVVRDLLIPDVCREIHRQIEEVKVGRDLLDAVAAACQRVIQFDLFGVTVYSSDGEHFRSFFRYPEFEFSQSVRWWPLTSFTKQLVSQRTPIRVSDYEAWLDRPEWREFKDEPDVQQFLKLGYHSSLSFPVVHCDQLIASVYLTRKRDKPAFTQQDEERFARLPIMPAVRVALHFEEVKSLNFTLELFRRIALVEGGPLKMAEALIRQIRDFFECENVSIFRPDEHDRRIWLVAQEARRDAFRLPETWSHPIDKGVTGRVLLTREPVYVPNVKNAPRETDYIEGYPETASEVCLPIVVNGEVYWILNIEDSRRNAFAAEEISMLKGVVREMELLLERTAHMQLYTELIKGIRDAVFRTDFHGTIRGVNPAAAELLGYTEEEITGSPLTRFFKDKEQADLIQAADYVPNDEAVLIRKDGAEIPVLFAGLSLARKVGMKLYVASDLSVRKRTETLEILRLMYNEIACQTKTPLALVFRWLDKLAQATSDSQTADLLAKTMRQLNRIELSYDRMLLYERENAALPTIKRTYDPRRLLDAVLQRLPETEAARVRITATAGIPRVTCDLHQISFCIESLLSYLLRYNTEDGTVAVHISADHAGVTMCFRGQAPEIKGGEVANYAEDRWAVRAITEIVLGEVVMRKFIEANHGGTYACRRLGAQDVEYSITLPIPQHTE